MAETIKNSHFRRRKRKQISVGLYTQQIIIDVVATAAAAVASVVITTIINDMTQPT